MSAQAASEFYPLSSACKGTKTQARVSCEVTSICDARMVKRGSSAFAEEGRRTSTDRWKERMRGGNVVELIGPDRDDDKQPARRTEASSETSRTRMSIDQERQTRALHLRSLDGDGGFVKPGRCFMQPTSSVGPQRLMINKRQWGVQLGI